MGTSEWIALGVVIVAIIGALNIRSWMDRRRAHIRVEFDRLAEGKGQVVISNDAGAHATELRVWMTYPTGSSPVRNQPLTRAHLTADGTPWHIPVLFGPEDATPPLKVTVQWRDSTGRSKKETDLTWGDWSQDSPGDEGFAAR